MDGYKIKVKGFLKHVKDSRGIILILAKRMGVSREHLTVWLNKNPQFWEHVYDEREGTIDIAESKLMNKLNNDEDWAIKFILASTNRGRIRGFGDPTPNINIVDKQSNVQINIENVRELIKKNEDIWN